MICFIPTEWVRTKGRSRSMELGAGKARASQNGSTLRTNKTPPPKNRRRNYHLRGRSYGTAAAVDCRRRNYAFSFSSAGPLPMSAARTQLLAPVSRRQLPETQTAEAQCFLQTKQSRPRQRARIQFDRRTGSKAGDLRSVLVLPRSRDPDDGKALLQRVVAAADRTSNVAGPSWQSSRTSRPTST